MVRNVKFAAASGTRCDTVNTDFELKKQVIELLQTLDAMGDGLILTLEVRYGLPFAADIEHSLTSPTKLRKEELTAV